MRLFRALSAAMLLLTIVFCPSLAQNQLTSPSEATYLRTLSPDQRKDYQELKADWEKHTNKGISQEKVGAFRAEVTLHSQFILGQFGYGTLFSGTLDDRTKEALRTYQLAKGLPVSSDVDAITYYALTKDSDAADKRVTFLPKYAFFFRESYVSADGVWDGMNKSENSIQTSHLECYADRRICLEADAFLLQTFGIPSVFSSLREYRVTKWDQFEVIAEDPTPDCERDQLLINAQEKSVTIISTPAYKNAGCKELLGKPETVTYRLIDGFQLYQDRMAAAQKAKTNLYHVSARAKAILEAK